LPSSSSSLSRSDYGSGGGSAGRYEQKRPITGRVYQPALKGSNDRSPRVKHKVTMSPEVERKFYPVETEEFSSSITANENDSQQRMERSTARKSRITDSFFDAKERLEEALAERNALLQQQKVIPPVAGAHPGQTVIVLSDTFINNPIGIEISPVHDPTNNARLLAVEIRQIDDEGRIAADGRIKVGDRLTEINQRPVYQMSISRARAYLHELQSCAHPTFTVDRPVETFLATGEYRDFVRGGVFQELKMPLFIGGEISHRSETSSSSVQKKPILSALQQANTTAIGVTSTVEITKHAQGFGFTVTSRDTAKGERLFYIGTVKRDGAAMGVLKAGDRLLEVSFLISLFGIPRSSSSIFYFCYRQIIEYRSSFICSEEIRKEAKHEEILDLDIALNETGSAGLGVSLKARAVMKPDGTRHDCGIFIKKVLHGGAAFKDGRLRINDQLIGIEDIDLRAMEKNSEASDAITKCLKAIGLLFSRIGVFFNQGGTKNSRSLTQNSSTSEKKH
uniref:PDZ domain-containing protein n=1 Tax=Toxocara canis TaxID=6265 RepID=A0A183V8B0_TOXCA